VALSKEKGGRGGKRSEGEKSRSSKGLRAAIGAKGCEERKKLQGGEKSVGVMGKSRMRPSHFRRRKPERGDRQNYKVWS